MDTPSDTEFMLMRQIGYPPTWITPSGKEYTPKYVYQDFKQHFSVINPVESAEAKEYWRAVLERERKLQGTEATIGFFGSTWGTIVGAFTAKLIFTGRLLF